MIVKFHYHKAEQKHWTIKLADLTIVTVSKVQLCVNEAQRRMSRVSGHVPRLF